MPKTQTTVVLVGTGGMARYHIRTLLKMGDSTRIAGLVDPSPAQQENTRALFAEHGLPCPPYHSSLGEFLAGPGRAETAFISTPHANHLGDATACLEAGMDTLLEKPMVISTEEARSLIATRDRTGLLLVVAFPGSLSQSMRKAKEILRAGELGEVTAASGVVHQNWRNSQLGTWRTDPAISGGGFLFDSGSHLINTLVDLVGSDVAELSALIDPLGTPVEINAGVIGRFRNGILFSLGAAGQCVGCKGHVALYGTRGVLRIGMWGEFLEMRDEKNDAYQPVPVPESLGVWEQFLKVRSGEMDNPCPPEVGLRFAGLMDMIRESAATGRTVRAR